MEDIGGREGRFGARLEEGHGAHEGANASQALSSVVSQFSSRHLFFIFAHPGFPPSANRLFPKRRFWGTEGGVFTRGFKPEVGFVLGFRMGSVSATAGPAGARGTSLLERSLPWSMPERCLRSPAAGGVSRVPSRFVAHTSARPPRTVCAPLPVRSIAADTVQGKPSPFSFSSLLFFLRKKETEAPSF